MSNDTNRPTTFLNRYLNGEVLAEDIDEYIDFWHEHPAGRQIYEFLGMTKKEYSLWLRDPDSLPHIARARRAGLPLEVALRNALEEFPVAARSANAAKIRRLMRWLQETGRIS
jgi:hypothetical protein